MNSNNINAIFNVIQLVLGFMILLLLYDNLLASLSSEPQRTPNDNNNNNHSRVSKGNISSSSGSFRLVYCPTILENYEGLDDLDEEIVLGLTKESYDELVSVSNANNDYNKASSTLENNNNNNLRGGNNDNKNIITTSWNNLFKQQRQESEEEESATIIDEANDNDNEVKKEKKSWTIKKFFNDKINIYNEKNKRICKIIESILDNQIALNNVANNNNEEGKKYSNNDNGYNDYYASFRIKKLGGRGRKEHSYFGRNGSKAGRVIDRILFSPLITDYKVDRIFETVKGLLVKTNGDENNYDFKFV